jgi:hypothetical protein
VTGGRHLRSLTFGLWGHLFAGGHITAPDRFPGCYQDVAVLIQRHGRWRWITVDTAQTGVNGWYRIRIRDLVGRYRALVPEVTLPSGDVCAGAISPVSWHHHG